MIKLVEYTNISEEKYIILKRVNNTLKKKSLTIYWDRGSTIFE